jgi:hypothetical protein
VNVAYAVPCQSAGFGSHATLARARRATGLVARTWRVLSSELSDSVQPPVGSSMWLCGLRNRAAIVRRLCTPHK